MFRVAPELLFDDADSLIGQRLGQFRIDAVLGVGGMGVVYLAQDERLERKVGLKLLPRSLVADVTQLERLKREARIASALNHPNIVTIHEIGQVDGTHYIATEFIEGITLRERIARGTIAPEEALDIASQVASALCVAHEAGIVHRDIKPENIMLRPDGYVKVLDFGIAKFTAQQTVAETTSARLQMTTQPGMITGTTRYMSPEQARGHAVDARSDVWSVGVVLYEMLAGDPPFDGETPTDVVAALLLNPTPAMNQRATMVAAALQSVVEKCLQKDRAQRFQTAAEMLVQLRAIKENAASVAQCLEVDGEPAVVQAPLGKLRKRGRRLSAAIVAVALLAAAWMTFQSVRPKAAAPGSSTGTTETAALASISRKSVAVLPFANLSSDGENAFFADGVHEQILSQLATIADLKVISRTSVMQYKPGEARNLREVAQQLGVAHVLEGSVQRAENRVRVTVQLIDARTDAHLWAQTYDREAADVFAIQSEVAKAIASQLQAKLTGREEAVLAARPTANPEAYDAYLRGLAHTRNRARTSVLAAQKHLREAVRIDPKFAHAWALLSVTNSRAFVTQTVDPSPALREEAQQAAETALLLQPNLGEAILAKGFFHYGCLKGYDGAARYFEEARQLLPNNSRVLESLTYVARRRGEWERSEAHFNEAERLDPRNAFLLTQNALSYRALRRFAEAQRKLDQALEVTPTDPGILAYKANIAQVEGDLARAAELLGRVDAPGDVIWLTAQAYQMLLEGRPASAIILLKQRLALPERAPGSAHGQLWVLLAWAQQIAGDPAGAEESWRHARDDLEPLLIEQPDDHTVLHYLALAHAGLGDKAAAFAIAERAVAANPIEKDALSGPFSLEILARVAAQTGEPDRAIAALEKVVSVPGHSFGAPLTPALLRLDPMFDPLRGDPRFEKLVAAAAPKAR